MEQLDFPSTVGRSVTVMNDLTTLASFKHTRLKSDNCRRLQCRVMAHVRPKTLKMEPPDLNLKQGIIAWHFSWTREIG